MSFEIVPAELDRRMDSMVNWSFSTFYRGSVGPFMLPTLRPRSLSRPKDAMSRSHSRARCHTWCITSVTFTPNALPPPPFARPSTALTQRVHLVKWSTGKRFCLFFSFFLTLIIMLRLAHDLAQRKLPNWMPSRLQGQCSASFTRLYRYDRVQCTLISAMTFVVRRFCLKRHSTRH